MIVNIEALQGLRKSFQTLFLEAYTNTPSEWERVAMLVPSTTKENTYGWLGKFPNMEEWIGDRVMSALAEEGFIIRNKPWANGVEVDRDDIEDDNLGVYSPLVQQIGMEAKLHPNHLVFELLKNGFDSQCYDGQYFFDSDHPVGSGTYSNSGGGSGTAWFLLCTTYAIMPFIFQMRRQPEFTSLDRPDDPELFKRNKFQYGADYRGNAGYGLWQLAYGSKQTLDADSYEAARVAMREQKNDTGRPLGIKPNLLVVPPSLEAAGLELLNSERDAAGATNKWRGTAELMVAEWLA